jgi:hypothetical protein
VSDSTGAVAETTGFDYAGWVQVTRAVQGSGRLVATAVCAAGEQRRYQPSTQTVVVTAVFLPRLMRDGAFLGSVVELAV